MALHRDIYWVGKQWAVTGHGIQACNQKQKSQFDIEGARLWDDGVQEAVRAEKWVNTDDFEKAVAVARKYYPEPPGWTSPKKPAAPREIEHCFGSAGRAGSAAAADSGFGTFLGTGGAEIRYAFRRIGWQAYAGLAHSHACRRSAGQSIVLMN